jgi:tetratricopeptide (TPR) repeat protein
MGEAGVGKSRLLYEFRKAIANEEVTLIEGRCLSYSTNVAYHPMIDLLQSTFDIQEEDDDGRIRDKVKRGLKETDVDEASTLPFILEMLSVKDSGIDSLGLSPEARKDKILDALKRIVLKGSEARPLVIAIEDLHWVDKSSEDAFKMLLDAISGAQVLLIFTYRPEFVHTWGSKSYHNQVNLNRLSNRETLAMAAHILGTEVIGSDLEELILEKTEGIPFFVEEFMKSLKDLEMIEWKDSGYYLAKDIKDLIIPSTIQDVIMARVDALPEGAKNVLQTGSAIGREFSCELIKRVSGVPQPEITSHLSALRDSELLYERGIFPQATYIFRHSLTQEVAYDSLLQKRKQEIHERVAEAIEELYQDRIDEFSEVLAHHYSRGENWEKAYQFLKLSAEKAGATYSIWEAYRLCREAIAALRQLPQTDENKRKGIEIRLMAGDLMVATSHPEGSLEILQEGERLAEELGDERSLVSFCGSMGYYYTLREDARKGTEYSEKAFKAAERAQDIQQMAAIGFPLCVNYWQTGKHRHVTELAPRVMDLLETADMETGMLGGLFSLYSAFASIYGFALAHLGDFEKGQAQFEKALRFATEMNDLGSMALAEYSFGVLFAVRGDGRNAVEHSKNAISYTDETQMTPTLDGARCLLGHALILAGEPQSALNHLEQSFESLRDGRIPYQSALYCMTFGMVYLELGQLENARSYIDQAIGFSQDINSAFIEARARLWLARVLGKSDPSRTHEAEEYILRAISVLDELGIRPYVSQGHLFLGELYADTGQREKALEALNKAEAEFKDMGMDYWLRRTEEVLERVKG